VSRCGFAGNIWLPGLTIAVGGSVLTPQLNRLARLRVTQSLFVGYGSTECGTVAYAPAAIEDRYPGASGYVIPSCEVQVCDADGEPVPAGVCGELRIRGECSVDGYLDDAASSAEMFRDGWFYPGDAGTVSDTGLLCVLGRTRDLMNLGGVKVASEMVEVALAATPGVSDLAAFALDVGNGVDSPWVAVVRAEGFRQETLVAHYRQRFPNLPALSVANIEKIPRNAMGKVQRNVLRSLVKQAMANQS
jgi:acyl-CoA synthetase (AMP-forming)/AMP-acid ligase II